MVVAGTTYVLGTLSFNSVKEECSYHFTYPEDSSKIHFNCDTGKLTGRLDHITWHRNIAHIKRVDDVAIEEVVLSAGPLFCSNPVITPIYVESLYFAANRPCLKETDHFRTWKGSQIQEVLSLDQSEGFSVIFMLVPSKLDTTSILVGTQFMEVPKKLDFPPCLADLCDMSHRPGRIRLWSGWDFLVVTSPLKCRILSPIPPVLGNSYRLPNYQNVPAAVTDLLMQANNLTKEDLTNLT
jgi:hypothetical protein